MRLRGRLIPDPDRGHGFGAVAGAVAGGAGAVVGGGAAPQAVTGDPAGTDLASWVRLLTYCWAAPRVGSSLPDLRSGTRAGRTVNCGAAPGVVQVTGRSAG